MDDTSLRLADILVENGYIVHVLTSEERGEIFVEKPVYIRVISKRDLSSEDEILELFRDIDFSSVETSIMISPDETLNMRLARFFKSQGVPIVIVSLKSSELIEEAEREGLNVISIPMCVLGRVQRFLSLKFYRITQVRGNISMLECLVTGDMKIIGSSIGELEREHNVSIVIIRRSDEVLNSAEEIIQEGDYLIAIGRTEDLVELVR